MAGLPVTRRYRVTFSLESFVTYVRAPVESSATVPFPLTATLRVRPLIHLVQVQGAAGKGNVTGLVHGMGGMPLSDVAIELASDPRVEQVRLARSATGAYQFTGLPPGTYTMTFDLASAYYRAVLPDIMVNDSTVLFDVEMTPGHGEPIMILPGR